MDPVTGDIFKGAYKSDIRHGNGLCLLKKTGVIYRGDWRDDDINGHGVLYCPPGEIIEANFTNGVINEGKIKILVIK